MEDLLHRSAFAEDVRKGLSATPKFLSSRYFYDAAGDALFRRIMELPEYYLTSSEYEIFSMQSPAILEAAAFSENLNIVELGPGDGLKSVLLLEEAAKRSLDFRYTPVDISPTSLNYLQARLRERLQPEVHIQPVVAEYREGLKQLAGVPGTKLILFLGSSIGNFKGAEIQDFFSLLKQVMQPGDYFLLGVDLIKDPALILRAYNDASGVTRAFNLNLLLRINRELGGDFDPTSFSHYPIYDPMTGEARSYLVSNKEQTVRIAALDAEFRFAQHEPVFMEVSRKFTVDQVSHYASEAGLRFTQAFYDCKYYFADILFRS